MPYKLRVILLCCVIGLMTGLILAPSASYAQTDATDAVAAGDDAEGGLTDSIPYFDEGTLRPAETPEEVSSVIQLIIIITVLSLAPAILVMTTCFTRIVVVLAFLRQALGTQQIPPSQIIIGLALFITFLIMAPIYKQMNDDALSPYLAKKISLEQAYWKAVQPLRLFMRQQTRKADLKLFLNMNGQEEMPQKWDDIHTRVLVPAFIISELKTAFIIGFYIYIPFLIIDMVTSSVLISMGMLMLPPVLISLPFKILLFVLVDGWNLLIGVLIKSFFIAGG